jgi:predicted nuclease with TOPRIM domain
MTKTDDLIDRIERNQAGIERNQANIASHERECAIRYEMINRQLDEGSKRFDRLEAMIISMYPFILVTIAVAEYLR